jgi:hypothetical protein
MWLHFPENYFFNTTFPTKYFQIKVTVKVSKRFQQQGGKYKEKYKDVIVTLTGDVLLSYISSVEIKTDYIWDTEEEIIELLNVLFTFFGNNQDISKNETYTVDSNDEEEAITYIISLLDSEDNI